LSAVRRLVTGLTLAAALLPGAWAAGDSACRADVQKHCANERPGGGRVVTCLQAHEAELSPACQSQLPALASCSAKVKQLCPDPKPRALRTCMKEHQAELGADCAALARP